MGEKGGPCRDHRRELEGRWLVDYGMEGGGGGRGEEGGRGGGAYEA